MPDSSTASDTSVTDDYQNSVLDNQSPDNTLWIGEDLSITKLKNSDTRTSNKARSCLPSITIECIGFKCSVISSHFERCGCSCPRLHTYLLNNHRCDSGCRDKRHKMESRDASPKNSLSINLKSAFSALSSISNSVEYVYLNDENIKNKNGCKDKVQKNIYQKNVHNAPLLGIFDDTIIKDEPVEAPSDNDFSIEDFQKELQRDHTEQLSVKPAKPFALESNFNQNFRFLIKEEIEAQESYESDSSETPLLIDEDADISSYSAEGICGADSQSKINSNLKNKRETVKHLKSKIKTRQLLESTVKSRKILHKNGNFKLNLNMVRARIKDEQSEYSAPRLQEELVVSKDAAHASRKVADDIVLTCKYCNEESKDIQHLIKHFEGHLKDGLIICYFCQRSFGDKTGMKRHQRIHTGERPYQCKICGKRFSLPGNFKKHRDIHEDLRTEPCTVCGKTFRRKEHLKYHMRTHTGERPFHCSICGNSFTARYSLQIHMNIHLGKKPYQCQYCLKKFSDKSTMRKHTRVHTGEKPFNCTHCGRSFGESGTLNAHLATHTDERPYQCDTCQVCFKTKGGLYQHQKIHTGQKPFDCKFCGMKFLMKYNMMMHERTHTGEKPYECSDCGHKFRSRSCLAKHVILHQGESEKNFHCADCNKRFFRKSHLERHMERHLGIKRYGCDVCDKRFCTKVSLEKHVKSFHAPGARRFPCSMCGQIFKRKVYVVTHRCPLKSTSFAHKDSSCNTTKTETGDCSQLLNKQEDHANIKQEKADIENTSCDSAVLVND